MELDWKKLIARSDIDVIDVCVPNVLHHDIVIAAAKATAANRKPPAGPACRSTNGSPSAAFWPASSSPPCPRRRRPPGPLSRRRRPSRPQRQPIDADRVLARRSGGRLPLGIAQRIVQHVEQPPARRLAADHVRTCRRPLNGRCIAFPIVSVADSLTQGRFTILAKESNFELASRCCSFRATRLISKRTLSWST